MLLLALGIPLIVFVVCAILFHWFVLLLIPFIWVVPSCIASWIEENFPMDWAFKNSNSFHGYK
jgi:CBS domain containing-hemolysin-like protein